MLRNNHPPRPHLTAEQIEVRIWAFVVVVVMVVFAGITASMLYSVIFVVQPIKSMAPIDQAFTKMLNDIVLLIVGGIGGIMAKRTVGEVAKAMASPPPQLTYNPSPTVPPAATQPVQQAAFTPQQVQTASAMPDWNWMGYKNPDLDESWVPPPPPTTPANFVDPAREEIAAERDAARKES